MTLTPREHELNALLAATEALHAEMPRCMCACKCQYVLVSSRSQETHTCFACRAKLHTGSRPVGADIEAVQ